MRVWVTRAEPGASATGARLAALGHDPLVAPLLAIRFLPPPELPGDLAALAFTSGNGVTALALHPDFGRLLELPVFAVGDATAKAARDAGFRSVRSAGGDVEALRRLLREHRAELAGQVLHPCAREPAGALSLEPSVVPAPVYEAVTLGLPEPVRSAWTTLTVVTVHSPRAARAFAAAASGLNASHLRAVCISAAAAAPLHARVGAVSVAAAPNERSLLAALGKSAATG